METWLTSELPEGSEVGFATLTGARLRVSLRGEGPSPIGAAIGSQDLPDHLIVTATQTGTIATRKFSTVYDAPANLTPGLASWTDWTDGGAPTFIRHATNLGIEGQSADDQGRWFTGRDIAVSPGQAYILAGQLTCNSSLGFFTLAVTWWTTDLQYISTSSAQPAVSGVMDAQVRGEILAPPTAAFARVEFRAMNGIIGTVIMSQPWLAVASTQSLDEALLEKAEREQVIQFNPIAALQKAIFADGFVPNSPEFDITHDGKVYRGQRAEHLQSGEVRVYYAALDDWEHVLYVVRV